MSLGNSLVDIVVDGIAFLKFVQCTGNIVNQQNMGSINAPLPEAKVERVGCMYNHPQDSGKPLTNKRLNFITSLFGIVYLYVEGSVLLT